LAIGSSRLCECGGSTLPFCTHTEPSAEILLDALEDPAPAASRLQGKHVEAGIFQALVQILGSVDPEIDHNVLPLAIDVLDHLQQVVSDRECLRGPSDCQ
jgi:hypothetical protein